MGWEEGQTCVRRAVGRGSDVGWDGLLQTTVTVRALVDLDDGGIHSFGVPDGGIRRLCTKRKAG